MNAYHCFWTNPYGMQPMYREIHDTAEMLELVRKSRLREDECSEVRSLTVVWGERLDFEPVEVVTGWRVKDAAR